MIVLQEVDLSDVRQDLQDEQSFMGIRRRMNLSHSSSLPFLRRTASDVGSVSLLQSLQNQPGSQTQAPLPQSAHASLGQDGSLSSILRTVQFSCQTYFFDFATGAVHWPNQNDDAGAWAPLDHVSSSETNSVTSVPDLELVMQEYHAFGPLAALVNSNFNSGGAGVVSNNYAITVDRHPVAEASRSSGSGIIQVCVDFLVLEFRGLPSRAFDLFLNISV